MTDEERQEARRAAVARWREKQPKKPKMVHTPSALFLNHVDNSGEHWLWTGGLRGVAVDNGKYGEFWMNGKTMLAHRASYELFVGPIPEGMLVLHTCDVPLCVKPQHLWLGTQTDNMRDAIRKGRLNRKALAAGFERDDKGRFANL